MFLEKDDRRRILGHPAWRGARSLMEGGLNLSNLYVFRQ